MDCNFALLFLTNIFSTYFKNFVRKFKKSNWKNYLKLKHEFKQKYWKTKIIWL